MSQSNFQDTFTKNENEQTLQYDDSAFYFFSTAVLTLIVIPLLVSIYRNYRARGKLNVSSQTLCSCNSCKSKIPHLLNNRKYPSGFTLKVILFAVLAYLLFVCGHRAATSKGFKTFDPYEILDLLPTASKQEIKSQYKQLARKLHPDKNPGDPDANQKYILLNKAYTCLTDENAMASCEKFGSPDGASGAFQVGIALPSFLLKKENKLVILGLFFILLLIVLPALVFYFYQTSEDLDEYGTNKSFLPLAIEIFKNENILYKNFIEIIVMTDEIKPFLGAKPEQIAALEKIRDLEFVPKFGLQRFRPFLKPFYILHAYMTGKPIAPVLQNDLCEILKAVVKVLNSLTDFSIQLYLDKRFATYVLGKPLSFSSIERLINFSQSFYQGLWLHEPSLLQLPYFTRDNIGSLKRKLKKIESLANLREQEDIKGKLTEIFDKDNSVPIDDILKANEAISNLEIDPQAFVEIEGSVDNEIYMGDIFTIRINIKRLNKPTFAHSKAFPFLKRESLIMMIVEPTSNNIIHYKKFNQIESVVFEEMKDAARKPGTYGFKILVKSDCYVDVDVEKEFHFEVKASQRTSPQTEFMHPDDEKALKESSFMTNLMKDVAGKDVDSDDELEAGEVAEEEKKISEQEELEPNDDDEIRETKARK
jgi:translocation protein SEC63